MNRGYAFVPRHELVSIITGKFRNKLSHTIAVRRIFSLKMFMQCKMQWHLTPKRTILGVILSFYLPIYPFICQYFAFRRYRRIYAIYFIFALFHIREYKILYKCYCFLTLCVQNFRLHGMYK